MTQVNVKFYLMIRTVAQALASTIMFDYALRCRLHIAHGLLVVVDILLLPCTTVPYHFFCEVDGAMEY